MHFRSGAEYGHNNGHLITYLLTYLESHQRCVGLIETVCCRRERICKTPTASRSWSWRIMYSDRARRAVTPDLNDLWPHGALDSPYRRARQLSRVTLLWRRKCEQELIIAYDRQTTDFPVDLSRNCMSTVIKDAEVECTVWVKKIPPTVFWNVFPNGWEFLISFYTPILRSFLH